MVMTICAFESYNNTIINIQQTTYFLDQRFNEELSLNIRTEKIQQVCLRQVHASLNPISLYE